MILNERLAGAELRARFRVNVNYSFRCRLRGLEVINMVFPHWKQISRATHACSIIHRKNLRREREGRSTREKKIQFFTDGASAIHQKSQARRICSTAHPSFTPCALRAYIYKYFGNLYSSLPLSDCCSGPAL